MTQAIGPGDGERYRAALEVIARGLVPPDRHGHYLAHRECVRLAREALTTPAKQQVSV